MNNKQLITLKIENKAFQYQLKDRKINKINKYIIYKKKINYILNLIN